MWNYPKGRERGRRRDVVIDESVEVGGTAELRGTLVSLSNRFYANGWGYGQLQHEEGLTKITGALEGHVVGSSIIARGTWKQSPQYGTSLECTTIIVDSVSGELSVIQAWAKKYCKEHEAAAMAVARNTRLSDRWEVLQDVDKLCAAGMDPMVAVEVAKAAASYQLAIKMKRALMELGFTDAEAEKLYGRYRDEAMEVIQQDPYRAVLERVLSFNRIDVNVSDRFLRNDSQRLRAAQVQALVGLLRDGHTCTTMTAMRKIASDIAGVYFEQIARVGVPTQIVISDQDVQLKKVAYQEHDIASWIVRAVELEDG